jgi:hypothetical protein
MSFGSVVTRKLFLEITVHLSCVSTIDMTLCEPFELRVGSVLAREFKNFFGGTLLNSGKRVSTNVQYSLTTRKHQVTQLAPVHQTGCRGTQGL